MIYLTRLMGRGIVVNADLLMTVESTPDTILTFVNGDKLVVKERVEDVVERVIEYRRKAGRLVVHHRDDDRQVILQDGDTDE